MKKYIWEWFIPATRMIWEMVYSFFEQITPNDGKTYLLAQNEVEQLRDSSRILCAGAEKAMTHPNQKSSTNMKRNTYSQGTQVNIL